MIEELIAIPVSEYEHLLKCKQMLEDKFAEEKIRQYNEYMEAVQKAVLGCINFQEIIL